MEHGEQVAVIMLAQNLGATVSVISINKDVTVNLAYHWLANVGRFPTVAIVVRNVTPNNISGGVVKHDQNREELTQ